jgi:hypothetical protein
LRSTCDTTVTVIGTRHRTGQVERMTGHELTGLDRFGQDRMTGHRTRKKEKYIMKKAENGHADILKSPNLHLSPYCTRIQKGDIVKNALQKEAREDGIVNCEKQKTKRNKSLHKIYGNFAGCPAEL